MGNALIATDIESKLGLEVRVLHLKSSSFGNLKRPFTVTQL